MKNISNSRDLDGLVRRVEQLGPDAERRWGLMTPGEMLCHLADATDGVLRRRVPPGAVPPSRIALPVKWLMLYSPMRFPQGIETRPGVNPRKEGTRPGDFATDRDRMIGSLKALAIAAPDSVAPTHFRFGTMSLRAWHHWAYKHTDHHLRQFGL